MAATRPVSGLAGTAVISAPGAESESIRLTDTESRSADLLPVLPTSMVIARAGPVISPGICALASMALTEISLAVSPVPVELG